MPYDHIGVAVIGAGMAGRSHAAGYRGATTTNEGIASRHGDPYAMPRVRVTSEMTAADLVALLHKLTSARPS